MSNLEATCDIQLPTVANMYTIASDSGVDTKSDIINLNVLKMANESNINPPNTNPNTITTTTTATTTISNTPTSSRGMSRFAAKHHKNLNLKISTTKFMPSNDECTTDATGVGDSAAADTHNTTSRSSKHSTISPATSTSTSTTSSSSNSATSNTSATVFPHEQYKTMKKLEITFDNVAFSVRTGFLRRENKQILKGITGQFRFGELSAIVGPSGAGKSTLLNIISGFTALGYTGDVLINGHLRDLKAFKPNVALITQDTTLQPYLTVKEAMHFSANLKIGSHMDKDEKRERVRKILEAIGLYEHRHTRTGNLSGGQRKRLAIALELVNNPPVLILDEPTSGLDSSTSNQCISLLKKLAIEGRTVICTIHQPSALSFEMFDQLYAIAEGKCIYSGGTENLVPFLADVGLECPETYNPADYLMEIATHDYGIQNYKLEAKIENGKNNSFRQSKAAKKAQFEAMQKVDRMLASGQMTPVTAPVLTPSISTSNEKTKKIYNYKQLTPINEMSSKIWDSYGVLGGNDIGKGSKNIKEEQQLTEKGYSSSKPTKSKPAVQLDPARLCKRENIYATPFYKQLGILLVRTFLILWRDKSLTTMRFVIHFVTALLIGCLYYGIGNEAGNALNNFRYVFYTIMFIMYCAFSSILVNFPLEFPIVSREHFNRWYSLRAYYVAITLADIPIQVICTSLFILTTYIMTDQPWEMFRLALFSFIVFLTALVGQSIGLAVGASLSVQLGAIFGPFFICPFLAFSGFFLQLRDAPYYLTWMFHVSFLKYSLEGAMLAIFGYDRPKMPCEAMYCHYSRPKIFLKDLDMADASYELSAIFLFGLFIFLRIVAFYIMSFRLRLFR